MLSRRLRTILLASLVAPAAASFSACASAPSPAGEQSTGQLQMALVATASGHTYRLRNATFTISGPTSVVLDSETQPDVSALTASLPPGSYTVSVSPSWLLERLDPSGPVQVNAALTSPNPQSFTVATGAATDVSFTFATDGTTVVTNTNGSVGITTTVTTIGTLDFLAGHLGGAGSVDGTGAFARFESPAGVASDGAGNLFVVDSVTSTIRKVVIATGQVTTIAGTQFVAGSADGVGLAAQFSFPKGITADHQGNLFIADTHNDTIRKLVIATGQVTTIAGRPNVFGSANGTGSSAQFARPEGIVADTAGNVYVADTENNTIRQVVVATGQVTTIAGNTGSQGSSADGVGSGASFNNPEGVALDSTGNLYVADENGRSIRQVVVATGQVTTIAGSPANQGSVDGVGTAAQFGGPFGLALDGTGDLFIADNQNGTIRKLVLATGQVTTVAGQAGAPGPVDGSGSAARFDLPEGLTADAQGNIYVADTGNAAIRTILVGTGDVSTVAGEAPTPGTADGQGPAARFDGTTSVRSDGSTNLYTADRLANTVRAIGLSSGQVTTLAGAPGASGSTDGAGSAARFNGPWGVAPDGSGNVYVTDSSNDTIRRIVVSTGAVTTLAGTPRASGSADGSGGAALFNHPEGLLYDGAGNLFVADFNNSTIRQVVIATGAVTTVAGVAGNSNGTDGAGGAGTFANPSAVASDGAGNLFVVDGGGSTIRQVVLATGQITTLAGSLGVVGTADGVGSAAQFSFATDLVADSLGNLYVTDSGAHAVRKVVIATGAVSTVIGTPAAAGVLLGDLPAELNAPQTLTLLPRGGLAIVDENSILLASF